jgi:hypothetical protein
MYPSGSSVGDGEVIATRDKIMDFSCQRDKKFAEARVMITRARDHRNHYRLGSMERHRVSDNKSARNGFEKSKENVKHATGRRES